MKTQMGARCCCVFVLCVVVCCVWCVCWCVCVKKKEKKKGGGKYVFPCTKIASNLSSPNFSSSTLSTRPEHPP